MAKKFNDFTYGVGLEITAQSFKQVKDDLKLNLDNLAKMVRGYGKILKVDPNADLSTLFEEMKKVKSIVDGINASDNLAAGFVDKGVLQRIAALETSIGSVSSLCHELNTEFSKLNTSMRPLTDAGRIKFPNISENIKNYSEDIKQTQNELKNLETFVDKVSTMVTEIDGALRGNHKKPSFKNSDVQLWIEQFRELESLIASGAGAEEISEITEKYQISLMNFYTVLRTMGAEQIKQLGLDGYRERVSVALKSVVDQFDTYVPQIDTKIEKLEEKLEELNKKQEAYITTANSQSASLKSLGVAKNSDGSDLKLRVKVVPDTTDSDWITIINKTIQDIEPNLKKVHLTPTFAKSKNIDKEMESNLAQINHAVNVELKVDDNVAAFNERIDRIDQSIKNAKKRLEENGSFKIKFDYEEGGNFKSVAYKIINQLKQVEVHVDSATSKQFIKELGALRDAANKELKNIKANVKFNSFNNLIKAVDTLKAGIDEKIKNVDIRLNINNEPEIIAKATLIRDKLGDLFDQVPVTFGDGSIASTDVANVSVKPLSEAAQKAKEDLEQCKEILLSLKQGFNSPWFVKLGDIRPDGKKINDSSNKIGQLLNEYYTLKQKLPDGNLEPSEWLMLYPEAEGNLQKIGSLLKQNEERLKHVERDLNMYMQKQIAYVQSRYEANVKILRQENEIADSKNIDTKDVSKTADLETASKKTEKLAMSADDAAKKVKSLNSTLYQQKKVLKDLEEEGINSKSFMALGEWDKNAGKFKKNKNEIQQLISQYKELKAAREHAGGKKAVGEEASLRGRLAAILRQQKQHVVEIIANNQDELKIAKEIVETHKEATSNKRKQSKLTNSKNRSTSVTSNRISDKKDVSNDADQNNTNGKSSIVKLDGPTLHSLAKDETLKSIDGKIGNILNKLDNGRKNTNGTNNGSNTNDDVKNSANDNANSDNKLAKSAENAINKQNELQEEIKQTSQQTEYMLSNTISLVREANGEVAAVSEKYKTADKIKERTENWRWVSHGKDEPATFEHTSTVYKTNIEAFDKLYQEFIKSLAKQKQIEQQITATNGPTSKLQAELDIQKDITKNLESQLETHHDLYTQEAKQKAVLEANKRSQQAISKIVGSQSDKDVRKQDSNLQKIVDNAQKKYKDMQYALSNFKIPMSDSIVGKFKEYERLLGILKQKQQEINDNPNLLNNEEYNKDFNTLLQQIQNVQTGFDALHRSSVNFLGNIRSLEDIQFMNNAFDPNNLSQMHVEMQEFANQAGFGAAKLIEFNDAERSATFEIKNGQGQLHKLTVKYDAATNSLGRYIAQTREALSDTQKFFNSLKHSFQNVARYVVSFGSVYKLFALVKQGVQYVRDIDGALTELKKVTDETDSSYKKFLQDMAKTGSIIGATVQDLTLMAAEWSRLGYSMAESAKLAESTAILLNVSEFQDATKASEALISTMQAFQYTADESLHVVDILNEIGNNYAISSDGIATALQDSASALMEGGNSLEQATALVAAANRVLQDPNSVGSALRTISLRLRGTSVKVLEEMGEETDNVVESTSKLQAKLKALTGVDILTDAGAYKDTYTILKEIGAVWKDLDNLDKAAALELMAGKNRANALSAILNNMEDLEGAYNDALKAENSAMRENDEYLKSIQGRVDLFNNALQAMWMNLINSDAVKWVVDRGTDLIKFLDSGAGKVTVLSVALLKLGQSLKVLPFGTTNNQFQILGKSLDTIKNNFAQFSTETNGFSALLKSIFTTPDVGGIDLSSMLSEDDFNSKINGWISGFNQLKGTINEMPWKDYVNGLTGVDDATKAALHSCKVQNGVIVDSTSAYQAYTGAAAGAAVGNTSVGSTAQITTAKLIGLKIAALAANAALTLGLSLIMTGVTQGISKLANAEKEAAEAAMDAAEAAEKLDDVNKSLGDYKDQITELRKELDNNTLSESEAYNAREQLLKIQNELIDKFGLEKDGINLVTGAINEQIAAIDKLTQKNAQDWINQHKKEINEAIAFFENPAAGSSLDGFWEGRTTAITNFGTSYDVMQKISKYANDNAAQDGFKHITTSNSAFSQVISFHGSAEDVKREVEEFMSWLDGQESDMKAQINNLSKLKQTSDVKKQIKTLQADLEQLQDVQEDLSVEWENWFGAGSTYAANKAVIEQLQQQTALTEKYATEYAEILEAQNALTVAQAQGDNVAYDAALTRLNKAFDAATAKASGTQYMIDFFEGMRSGYETESKLQKLKNDIQNGLSIALTADGKFTDDTNFERSLKSFVENILGGLDDMNAKEILQLGEIDPNNHSFVTLTNLAQSYGLELKELLHVLVQLGYIEADFKADLGKDIDAVKTYSALASQVENYKDILSQTSEVISNNTEVTQEYKDSLKELGISETDLAKCFDENNKLVVTNAKLLNNLVKNAKAVALQNTRLAKSQAMLQYTTLYKKIHALTNGEQKLAIANREQIEALYAEMGVLQKTIAKYSLLEQELLGATNAYTKFQEAQEADSQTDYIGSLTDMVAALGDAFNTATLGSETAQAAIMGLVPESVYSDLDTVEEKMAAIYEYFKSGPLSQYFNLEFDEEGNITSAEMLLGNLRTFIEAGMGNIDMGEFAPKMNVFEGTDWQHFELSDQFLAQINSLPDGADRLQVFADAMGVTREVALAFLESLEDHDIEWLDGDYTSLLDYFSGLESRIYTTQSSLAELDMQLAQGSITSQEYAERYSELSGVLAQSGRDALHQVTQYQDLTNQIESQKAVVNEATAAFEKFKAAHPEMSEDNLRDSNAYKDLLTASAIYTELIQKRAILTQPTEFLITFAMDSIEEEFKEKVDFGENGEYTVKVGVELSKDELMALEEYKKLCQEQYTIETDQEQTKTALEEIEATAQGALDVINMIDGATIEIDTSSAISSVNALADALLGIPTSFSIVPNTYTETSDWWNARVGGTAHASGNWGLPSDEHNSLVGELGPELVVDPYTSRYYTVGDNGAEMVNLKRGSIIFNHKQTEGLLKNGRINSRGKAYASGNAHVTLWPNGSSETQWNGTGWDNWIDYTYDLADALNDASDAAHDFEETMNYFEVLLEEVNERLDLLSARLERAAGATEKNAIVDSMITEKENLLAPLLQANGMYWTVAQQYLQKLSPEKQALAQNGAVNLEYLKGSEDEETYKIIEEYRKWAQLEADALQQWAQTKNDIADLAKQRFDNIVSDYDNQLSQSDNRMDKYQIYADLNDDNVNAIDTVYQSMMRGTLNRKGILKNKQDSLYSALQEALDNGWITEGDDVYNSMMSDIRELDVEILQASADLEDLAQEKFDAVATRWENQIEDLRTANDAIAAGIEQMEQDGYQNVNDQYKEMIGNITGKDGIRAMLQSELEDLEAALKFAIDTGLIKEGTDEWYEMKAKISGVKAELVECNQEVEELVSKQFDNISNQFENELGLLENENEQIQAKIDLLEEQGEIPSPAYYEELIENSELEKAALEEEKAALQAVLDEQIALGNIQVGSDQWYEMIGAINEVDSKITKCTMNTENFQNAINDLHWERFDELIKRYDYLNDEAQNLIDLMDEADMVITPDSEDGWGSTDVQWSAEGLATLGLYAQKMDVAEKKSQEYASAIEELNRQYADGRYSETEYLEKLNELKNAQYDSIEAYQDAKKAIVDMNKARVDEIKNGINKQVDAYEKLIQKKKELLSNEKDAYDFQKNITKQQKDITEIQRQLDALAWDNSASARAKRAELQAQLAEAQASLEESYYDRSIQDQQAALDRELDDFKAQKDAELEQWDKYLEDVETIIAESLVNIKLNADDAFDALSSNADNYGVILSDDITTPWIEAAAKAKEYNDMFADLEATANSYGMTLAEFLVSQWKDGENSILDYDNTFGNSTTHTIEQLESIKDAWKQVTDEINKAADALINQDSLYDQIARGETPNITSSTKPSSSTSSSGTSSAGNSASSSSGANSNNGTKNNNNSSTKNSNTRNDKEKYGVALAIWNGNYGWGVGNTRIKRLTSKGFNAKEIQDIVDKLGKEGYVHSGAWIGRYYGIKDLTPYSFNKYAKGTTGVKNNQWALIDELGEELVMHASGGRLAFLTKGSSVIPADITENLMEIGSVGLQDMLDRNRPQITAPHIVNNEINIDCSVGNLVHIEHCDQNTLPDVEKIVNKAFEKHMQTLNNSIRRYSR